MSRFIRAGEAHVGEVGGKVTSVSANFTRPADTAAYAAKDAVSNSTSSPTVLTFTSLARLTAGSGHITKARIMTSQTTCTARFRLHLFNAAPTPINDNAAYTLLYANAAARIGTIDFPATQTEGTGSTAANAMVTPGVGNCPLTFKCAADANVYGLLENLDAFTPANAQTFYLHLDAEVN